MSKRIRKPVFTFMGGFVLLIMLSGCIIHVGATKGDVDMEWGSDYSSVNKSLTISEGKEVGDVSAVNGSLTIRDNVTADDISSVNGSVKIGDNVSAKEITTVNGRLSAGKGLKVSGEVGSVNGTITLSENSVIEGELSTVNGTLELSGVTVAQNIETVNGSIDLDNASIVKGDIVYRWNKGNSKYKGRNPVLKISEDSIVEGRIILERPVDLEFENRDLESKVVKKY